MFSLNSYKKIGNLISGSKISVIGASLVSILLPVLAISIFFDSLGLIDNPYFGFLLYVVMTPLLTLGIVLLFVGSFFSRGREELGTFTVEYLKEQFTRPGRYARVRKFLNFTVAITLFLVFVVGIASYSSFQYTSSPSFCGQFCHDVMQPQYTAFKNSPHSTVPCVDCHLGKDADWAERSRFTGVKQLFAVATNSYPKPILSPIEHLRPGRKTCEQCHLPDKFHGSRLYTKNRFLPDEKNTKVGTAILMKVGSGDIQGNMAHGIHWHVSENQQVLYRAADHEREIITEVRQVEKGKKDIIYTMAADDEEKVNPNAGGAESGELRKMDCIDCHNRPTHIFLSAEEALDQKLSANIIPPYLPFIKRQALAAIKKKYDSREVARVEISRDLQNWYSTNYPELILNNPSLFERAVQGTVQAYEENVFPKMDVEWGVYKNFLGHTDGSGCFRCHGKLQETQSGRIISSDCNLCHVILAENEEQPEIIKSLQEVID